MTLRSCDTNILLHALNSDSPSHGKALQFLNGVRLDPDFRLCELVLVELYVLLRNPAVLSRPLGAEAAAGVCLQLRSNPIWGILDYPGPAAQVMENVWQRAREAQFARRRIFDARLAFTLLHYGVSELFTQNTRDFQGFGFRAVVDPLSD